MNIPPEDHEDDDAIYIAASEAPQSEDSSTQSQTDDDADDIINQPEQSSDLEASAEVSDDDDVIVTDSAVDNVTQESNGVEYDPASIDLRGEPITALRDLINKAFDVLGAATLDERAREINSWENTILRSITEPSFEEMRIQEALSQLEPEDRAAMASKLRDPETGKVLLRTAPLKWTSPATGQKRKLSGNEALMAFENLDGTGGGIRIPLYNSGITIDIVVPTGNDLQTMLTNCLLMDNELGASQGAHYFAFSDLLYKRQIIDFIRTLIVDSSYTEWRSRGKLWSVIKYPDLEALVMNIAALCYKDGFDNFRTRCTRPVTEEHPELCRHQEVFTANLFEMIVTRFSAMNKQSIDFMVDARAGKNKNSIAQITNYQKGLSLDGERITVGRYTFVMRVPSVMEYVDAAQKFLADIQNEVQGDNSDGEYEQVAFRYIRSFLPWIESVEGKVGSGDVVTTTDDVVITRALEKLDREEQATIRTELRKYINRVQLTYVGHPALPCPSCGHVADTPSGMLTLDPFTTFFTLAFLYTKPTE